MAPARQSTMTKKNMSIVWNETRTVARISGPLAAIYAADIAMYLTDMAIVGRLGIAELAGVALAEQVVFLVISVLGALISLTSVAIASAVGANDPTRAVHNLQQGFLIVIAVAVPATLLAWHIDHLFSWVGVDPEVVLYTGEYGRAVAWCVLPYLLFMLLRGFLAALDRSSPILATTIVAVVLNAPLSYALTFGVFGFSGLGVAGAGISTSIVTVVMVASLVISISRSPPIPGITIFSFKPKIDLSFWARIFRKGTPAATATLLEDSMFVVVGVVVGSFGSAALAAHYVVNSIVNIGNVISNGIGDATAVRVATHHGAGRLNTTRVAGYSGVGLCCIAMVVFAIGMLLAPTSLTSIFVGAEQPETAAVMLLAEQLFLIAALSLIVEGVQVVAARALRGLEDTFVPFVIALVGHWIVALPAGLFFAHFVGLGVKGMWLGLTCGLTLTAIAFLWRYNRLTTIDQQKMPQHIELRSES